MTGENPCHEPASPRYGQINCHQVGADTVCTVSCSMGFRFESVPAQAYTCDSQTGAWTPSKDSIPNCVQGDLGFLRLGFQVAGWLFEGI